MEHTITLPAAATLKNGTVVTLRPLRADDEREVGVVRLELTLAPLA
jgi:hypothetical protein